MNAYLSWKTVGGTEIICHRKPKIKINKIHPSVFVMSTLSFWAGDILPPFRLLEIKSVLELSEWGCICQWMSSQRWQSNRENMFAPLKYWSWRMYFNQNISTTHPNQHPTCSCPSSTVVLWFSRQNRWTWFLELLVKYAFNISLTSYIMLFLFVLHNSSSSRHVFHVHMLSWVITVHIETRLKGRKQLLPNETEMMTLIDELKEEVHAVIMSNTGLCSLWNSGLT